MDKQITIAKCNVDLNNIPVEVNYVPSIKLFPAYRKHSPVEYFDTPTDVEQYVVFIKEEGTKPPKVQKSNSPLRSKGFKEGIFWFRRKA